MDKRILIVDDDPDIILFLKTLLQDHGYRTLIATNGREGFNLVEHERPDLVLLDLMMPQRSGLSVLSDIKSHEELRKIPIIMVTGVSGETGIDLEPILKQEQHGSEENGPFRPEGYIEKPVDPDKLIALIKEVLNRYGNP